MFYLAERGNFLKKFTVLILILIMAGCAGTNIVSKTFKPENIVHYSQLDKLESIPALNSHAVYLDQGDMFPLELSLDTGIIGIEDTKIDMVAKQKLFFMLKMPENLTKEELTELENLNKEKLSEMSESERRTLFKNFMLYVSKDAEAWAPVTDITSIKKIFGSKGGAISFGMGMSSKKGIWSSLSIKEVK